MSRLPETIEIEICRFPRNLYITFTFENLKSRAFLLVALFLEIILFLATSSPTSIIFIIIIIFSTFGYLQILN